MGSFAFYSNKEQSPLTIDTHFNLWNQCGWENNDTFLDIGIMLYDLKPGHELCISFPFRFWDSDLINLDNALQDVETLNAIFNESYSLRTNETKWIDVIEGTDIAFRIYLLDLKNKHHFSVESKEGNTLATLKIPIKAEMENKVYIRFRIRISHDKSIIRSYDRPYKRFRGVFQQSYIIDFRYNDKRSLSKNMLEEIESGHLWVKTNSVHFLLISKAAVNVECGDTVKKRMLEGNVWSKYLENGINKIKNSGTNDLVAYHAKAEASNESTDNVGHWEFFAKQDVENINKSSFCVFLIITIFFSIFCGVFGNIIYNYLLYIIGRFLGIINEGVWLWFLK